MVGAEANAITRDGAKEGRRLGRGDRRFGAKKGRRLGRGDRRFGEEEGRLLLPLLVPPPLPPLPLLLDGELVVGRLLLLK